MTHPIDCLALRGRHYIDHIAPVWNALPIESRGTFYTLPELVDYAKKYGIVATPIKKQHILQTLKNGKGLVLLVGHADSEWTDKAGRKSVILMHGTGFNFDVNKSLPNYPGTTKNRENVVLMLSTNEAIAEMERAANPHIDVEVIGCPKLDDWYNKPKKKKAKKPVIALAWHWRCQVAPEAGTAFDYYKRVIPKIAEKYTVIGHGHPNIIDELRPFYEKLNIEVVEDADEVFERADLLVCDASSLQYEWATLDRPQVVLNCPRYRRNVDFGLRFWKHADVGVQCDKPDDLLIAIETALEDKPGQQKARREAAKYAYAFTDGKCTMRAATAILDAAERYYTAEPVRVNASIEPPNRMRHMRSRIVGGITRRRLTREERLAMIAKAGNTLKKKGNTTDAKDRDEWLSVMGWRIPKAEVKLTDPATWPSVALIIPVYNAPNLLKRCLESLTKTNYAGKFTVQIVDNASYNKEALDIISKQASVIRFDEPVGFSEAVNAGMKAVADHDYHILFNQDVAVIDAEWLNHLIRWMEHKPECAICGPKLLYDNGKIENAGIDMGIGDGCAERGRGYPANDPRFNDYRKVATVSGAVYCMRASIEQDMGLFDERYLFGCEDLEYGMRVSAKLGLEVWYVPDSVLIHSSHAVQKHNKVDQERVRAMRKVSSDIYEREWGAYYNHLAGTRVAFVLPNFHSACGGARVVGALARQLSICGVRAEVFARSIDSDPDTDFPMFPIRHISELKETDIVIATRFDTLKEAGEVTAKKRYYFVQQIEDVMARNCGSTPKKALESYKDTRFEIITIGEHLAARLKEFGRDSTIVDVGFYRDMYPYVERELSKHVKVLMYGAEGHKGPDAPVVASEIRKALPGVTINSFHRYAELPKWSDEHFRPETTKEVADLYAGHDIYVYASLSDGLAMTPIEAMACGTPVILTDFPGKDQYAIDGENCLIVPFRDAKAVGEAVARLAGDKKLWKRLVEGGLETAKRYDWSRVGAQYAKLLLGAPV